MTIIYDVVMEGAHPSNGETIYANENTQRKC